MTAIQCVVHCRVSTGKQAYEGESLAVQESLCLEIAARNGWTLAHAPWLEAYSGRKSIRPAFADILQFLDDHPGQVGYYLFRSIDRFTRRGTYTYEGMKRALADRGVRMIDSMGVIQQPVNSLGDLGFEYDWSIGSPSEITEVVMATTAKAEVTTILTRLIGQEIRLAQRGYKIRGPQDGYKNEKIYVDGKRRTIQVPDPERAPFYIKMFELRASGQLSDEQIVVRLNAIGFRTRTVRRWDAEHRGIIGTRGGVPLTVKRFQEIIKRPIYCGVVWEKWTNWQPIRAAYPGLVSIEIYNAANRGVRYLAKLEGDGLELKHNYRQTVPLNRNNPLFPYKNVILCPACRKPFMASSSRSRSGYRVPAYHCSRKHKRIAYNKVAFEKIVSDYVGRLRFQPHITDLLIATIYQKYGERHAETLDDAAAVGRMVADLEAEKAANIRAFPKAMTTFMQRAIEEEIVRLDREIAVTMKARHKMEVSESELDRYTKALKEVMDNPGLLLDQPTSVARQKSRFMLLFQDFPTIDELASGTAKLSLLVEPCEGQTDPNTVLVRLQGLNWNGVVISCLKRWLQYP
ncbi:recombinase family protein [Sphingobium sp. AN641]|uniref:recombinase family protein n=1 Tax=Sphingobium sp. AN641 TaxID=3133443 RepID=UPI0030BC1A5E